MHNPGLIVDEFTANKADGTEINVNVIREDYLPCGTKQRGYFFFKSLRDEYNAIALIAAANGYGQLAASWCANRAGIQCHIFYNTSISENMNLINRCIAYGAYCYNCYNNGTNTTVTRINDNEIIDKYKFENTTRKNYSGSIAGKSMDRFCEKIRKEGKSIKSFNTGIDNLDYINELSRCIRIANIDNIYPKRLWLTVGSGTILSALFKIWPKTEYMIVQVGMEVDTNKHKGMKYVYYRYPSRFQDKVSGEDIPPYPSVLTYDAKLWHFVRQAGEEGDYIWNTAAD